MTSNYYKSMTKILLISFFLAGCSVDIRENCRKQLLDGERHAAFIIDCATAANPMSDEEGEDLVYQCELTARSLFKDAECVPFLESKSFGGGWRPCKLAAFGSRIEAACAKADRNLGNQNESESPESP